MSTTILLSITSIFHLDKFQVCEEYGSATSKTSKNSHYFLKRAVFKIMILLTLLQICRYN